ncbi:MAG: ATP-binding protein [Planctomycetota bacterium]
MKLQWTRLLRQRLGLKLALVATTVPVVVLLLFGRLLVESDRKAFRAAYQDRAVTIARITASALREPVVLQDWSVIDEFVSTTVGTEEGLAFAYVRRADGKRVAGRGLEGVAESVLSGSGVIDGRYAVRRGAIEVEGEVLGWVVIGLSLDAPERALSERSHVVLLSASGVGLLTALLMLLALRHQVMTPLKALGANVRALGRGNYEEKIELGRIDELGSLGDALDRMRCELRNNWRELTDQHADQLRLLDQLSAALQQSRAADIAKGRFLATVSHEVRTPLNGIIGMASLLELSDLDSEQRDLVGTLVHSGHGLLRIIEDVLDFSRLDSHDVELRPVEADLVECTREVLNLAVAGADQERITAHLDVEDGLPTNVFCDPLRLRQVLWNVIGNAVKYTSVGSIRVRICRNDGTGCDASPEPGPETMLLRFEVEDTGIGIDRRQLERIFHPFSQVDDSDTRRHGGTGLGLAIAKQLVELMGGQIGVHSELGAGATFWFTVRVQAVRHDRLQRASQEAASLTDKLEATARRTTSHKGTGSSAVAPSIADLMRVPPTDAEPSGDADGAAGSAGPDSAIGTPDGPWTGLGIERPRALVLLAEDNPVNQLLATRLLERFGLRVVLAQDGQEAVERWQAERPALVLMDCQMPRLDGFGATRQIRALEGGGDRTPIVAVTANAMPGDRERCLAHGMNDYLAKPYRPEELREIVERWLARTAHS